MNIIKSILLSIIACLMFFHVSAQDWNDEVVIEADPKSTFSLDDSYIADLYNTKKVRFGKFRSYLGSVAVGYNALVENMGNLRLPQEASCMKQKDNSLTLSIQPLDIEIISTRNFALISGIGMEFNTFRLSGNTPPTKNADNKVVPNLYYNEQGINLTKSKLSTNYFTIPLLAEYRFGSQSNRKFFVQAGIIGGWMYNGHTKVKYNEGNTTVKQKNHSLPFQRFRYGYTISAGWSYFGVFARYYPGSVFKDSAAPSLRGVSVGIVVYTTNINR